MNEYAKMLMIPTTLLGRIRRGNRISSASNVERAIVPKRVVVECWKAAITTSLDEGEGTTLRWKYHCETVAAVVALWSPLTIERDHIYMRTKNTPSHHVPLSMMNTLLLKWPERNTRVNMPSQSQVPTIIDAPAANPRIRRPGLAARILLENSRIPMAFWRALRPL